MPFRRKTTVELAVVTQQDGVKGVFMCPVLSVERVGARGDAVVIPLDVSNEKDSQARLLAPTRQNALTRTFVLRYEPSSTILRFRAPNAELYTLWTSAIVTAMQSGHTHSINAAKLSPRCLVKHGNEVGESVTTDTSASDGNSKKSIQPHGNNQISITVPSSVDKPPTTISALLHGPPVDACSLYSSTLVVDPSSVNVSTLSYQLYMALLRQDFAETWIMEARKNLLLRVNDQAPRVAIWSAAAILSVLRLRAVRTFQAPFDLYPSPGNGKSKQPTDGITTVAMTLRQNVYVVADLVSECESPARLAGSSACSCHLCTSRFLVYSPAGSRCEWRVSALEWLRRMSREILKASRSPVLLHVTGRSTCSLLRFSELISRPKTRWDSIIRGTIDLSSMPGAASPP